MRPKTHGMKGTREYSSWNSMKNRCNNPNSDNYKDYGGRGITYCERWENFENFYRDMGKRPEGKSLDRIDTNGNYEPDNCRWASDVVQHNNRRDNRRITAYGMTRTVAHWARHMGVNRHTLAERLNRGMAPEDAIAKPLGMPKLGRAKINESQVVLIKKFLKRHTYSHQPDVEHVHRFLERWFPLTSSGLRKIKNGSTWKSVKV
jgi:hypothetical protein